MQADEATLRGLLSRDVVREVGAELTARGVRWVALKGVALHVMGCRKFEERPVEDIDILVDEERLEDALEAAERVGFERGAEDAVTVTLARRWTPLPLDVHYRLFEPGLFRLEARGVLAHAEEHGGVWVPSAVDLYAHLVGHFAKGRLSAEDRVHLSDFASVAGTLGLEPGRVAQHLSAHGLARAARHVLSLAADKERDAFARDVLAALPSDPLGHVLAAVARRALGSNLSPAMGTLVASALNDTLPRGAVVFVRHARRAALRKLP